ncbi:MAG: DMT family transporter [Candidatus Andeanibacterium colombiense]|uniref:DMT family transporter n=1 Tax=Candidatus Andeanibacterium colombiense TaxID=3121345 RepID=A0AAJ6BR46_9SPHN|nr:MAG: DMT family transporter [Sphingomonadaceae bacterium]
MVETPPSATGEGASATRLPVAWPGPDGSAPRVEAAAPRGPYTAAIAMVMGAVGLFSLSDIFAKQLSASLPAVQVTWMRYVLVGAIALLLAIRRKRPLRPARPLLQVLRGVTLLGAGLFFIMSLHGLGVAEATAISFVTPAFITLLAVPLLGEAVGARRWTALLIGLAGVLIVVRPGAAAFQPAALLPLASALCGAVMAIVTRRIGASDSSETTLFWSAAVGLGLLTLSAPWWWSNFDAWFIAPALLMGGLYGAGQYLLVMAYGRGDASMVAPFSYVQVVFATALGAAVFGHIPDAISLGGIGLVIASGAYTLHREGMLPDWRRRPAVLGQGPGRGPEH